MSLDVGGKEWTVRTDFRAVLDILRYFRDSEYELDEQWEICRDILYEDYEHMPRSLHREASEKATWFIDMGMPRDSRKRPNLMDWDHDAQVIIPAVNRVLGTEVRTVPYMHWWTFLGAYMEIGGEGLFPQVLHIRKKRAERKKLEKWEEQFYAENKALIDLKDKQYERSEEEKNALRELIGRKQSR